MLILIGLVILFASIFGGYVLAHGKMLALWQPYEILIIAGGAFGAMIIANPPQVLRAIGRHTRYVFGSSGFNKIYYDELMHLLNAIFVMLRRQGGRKTLEEHIENPAESSLFNTYPRIATTPHVQNFIVDNLRLVLVEAIETHELEALIEEEMHNHEVEMTRPVQALQTTADALPGFGIMAAVLGIVITMQSLDGPAGQIGTHIAAALVGTFMGVFLGYGVVGPLAAAIEHSIKYEMKAYELIKTAIVSHHGGTPPEISIDAGRKMLFGENRPSFTEMEEIISEKKPQS
ncbi:flagellar motor stator protein MotA [Endozoicomonas arenosclerae]|uniref:flagellar motor stator protein MotA n=1 Tax=Endozoicomonas arenosclerae TaxID=1633495 RepID=UPI0007828E80|nr:flagellar motor stator protein MotA [Endozoicomonas arenosclerae]